MTDLFNINNPTVKWSEDENYEFAKWENQWLKKLTKHRTRGPRRNGRVSDSATNPTFGTIEELDKTFQTDIAQRKKSWKHLCSICDFATNQKTGLTTHLIVHGI